MKIVTPVPSDSGQDSDNHSSPEIRSFDHLNKDGLGRFLRSPFQIRDFLRQRMAVCLPRIGAIGQPDSVSIRRIAPAQRKPVLSERRHEIDLVVGR